MCILARGHTLPSSGSGIPLQVKISSVNEINQTNHSTNQERPCTNAHRIEKELSTCQPLLCLDLVNDWTTIGYDWP